MALKQIFKNVWQTPGEHVYSDHVKTSAILVHDRLSDKNIVFYSSKHLEDREALQNAEGNLPNRSSIWRQFVNHRDEASVYNARLYRSFRDADTPMAHLYCHERELNQVLSNVKTDFAEQFVHSFDTAAAAEEEELLDGRLRIVHTPGHCPGSTCFLWTDRDDNSRRYLFCGDTIYFDESRDVITWRYNIRVHPYEGNVQDLIESIRKIDNLDFDVLVPSLSMARTVEDCAGVPMIDLTLPQNRNIKRVQIDRMLRELETDLEKYRAERGESGAKA